MAIRVEITNMEITEDEQRKVLKLIDPKKLSAISHIQTIVIFYAIDYVLEKYLRMYNMSSSSSDFPMPWKISIFVPLPKVTNPLSLSDLIPFSLIPLSGNIFLYYMLYLFVIGDLCI